VQKHRSAYLFCVLGNLNLLLDCKTLLTGSIHEMKYDFYYIFLVCRDLEIDRYCLAI
jgi:hypothetical protein